MTLKEELTDWLAEVHYDNENSGLVASWDQLEEDDIEQYRLEVEEYVPVIVAFVADWMQSYVSDGFFTAEQIDTWREVMS